MSGNSELTVKNMSHTYTLVDNKKLPVLHNVDFDIQKGTFTIIFGPSGSGKSTLLNILTGMLKPTEGQLMYRGIDLYSLSPEQVAAFRSSILGRVHQTSYWVKSITSEENVALPLFFQGFPKHKALERARSALDELGMADYGKKYPTRLSGGEQQRVAIARALVSDPQLIVADEPTGNLDTKNSDMVVNLLEACRKDLNKTIVLVTHDLRYLDVADRLLRISDGQISDVTGESVDELTKEMQYKKEKNSETIKK